MRRLYIDATTLIALGTVGELTVLSTFGEPLVVLPEVQAEVTTEPARTNLERFLDREFVVTEPGVDSDDEAAMDVLDETEVNGDVRLIGAILANSGNEKVAVVSDDQRVRTVARGFGADVTVTIGAIVRTVGARRSVTEAKSLLRRIDDHGLHMTAELRSKAEDLIETAAEENDSE